ncbi:hypothetical protein D6C76_05250 [Aureobasidium pullulans]|nr:hypothetical protein D6C76_05250 [Aureobasidium pullulans]
MSSASQPSHLEIAASSVQARQCIRNHIYQTPLISARSTGKSTNATVPFGAENSIIQIARRHGQDVRFLLRQQRKTSNHSIIRKPRHRHCICGSLLGQRFDSRLAEQHAQHLASTGQHTYISPYNDFDVISGQGTIALELLEQCDKVDNIFISMGGGGLISGIGSVLKAFSPHTKIWGISASNSMALATSIHAGKVIETEHLDTLADAVAGGIDEDTITLSLATSVIDEFVECDEDAIVHALKALALEENMIVEGAAALALAGFVKVDS